jgi:hypothetical protein
MNEKGFSENFVWYEWSFVSPDDFPHSDSTQRVPGDRREDDRLARVDARVAKFDGWDVAPR